MSHRGGCGCEPNTGDGAGDYLKFKYFYWLNYFTRYTGWNA